MAIAKYYNQTLGQWESLDAGGITDGTNRITPNEIGILSQLTTTSKQVVGAINEVDADASKALTDLGGLKFRLNGGVLEYNDGMGWKKVLSNFYDDLFMHEGKNIYDTTLSTTYKNIFSLTGKGVIKFLELRTASSTDYNYVKTTFKINIDGRIFEMDYLANNTGAGSLIWRGGSDLIGEEGDIIQDFYFNNNFSVDVKVDPQSGTLSNIYPGINKIIYYN